MNNSIVSEIDYLEILDSQYKILDKVFYRAPGQQPDEWEEYVVCGIKIDGIKWEDGVPVGTNLLFELTKINGVQRVVTAEENQLVRIDLAHSYDEEIQF